MLARTRRAAIRASLVTLLVGVVGYATGDMVAAALLALVFLAAR